MNLPKSNLDESNLDSNESIREEIENLTTWLIPKDTSNTKEAKAVEELRSSIVSQILSLIATETQKARLDERELALSHMHGWKYKDDYLRMSHLRQEKLTKKG